MEHAVSNVVPFRPAEFVNIHGKPIGVTMKQLVLRQVEKAWCHHRMWTPADRDPTHIFTIRVPEFDGEPPDMQGYIGTGATEEAAWRDAFFVINPSRA
jgi:hypothetical protein